jgi:hypothetical protein
MITWGVLKTQIRRSLLQDPNGTKYSDDVLRDSVGWALAVLASHTAMATSTSAPATLLAYPLPDNMLETPDVAGLVTLESGSDIRFLRPVYHAAGITMTSEKGFYCWPREQLNINVYPPDGYTMVIRYYAGYNKPSVDNDVLTIPLWAEMIVAYQTAVYALSSKSLKEANLSQFDRKPDSGTPEDNAMRQQQLFWQKMVEQELVRHPRQQRLNPDQEER